MNNNSEITKLACLLAKEGIPFELCPWVNNGKPTIQIASPNKECCIVDAVCHDNSYGGKQGLLEVLGSANPNLPNDDVVGWLTANEAFQYFTEM